MRLFPTLISTLILGIILAGQWGCNTSGCSENRNAVPLAQFCSSPTGENIGLDSVEVSGVGAPGDTVLSVVGRPVSQVYLPMRPTYDNVAWCLSYKWKALDYPELNDTLSFEYSSVPVFASEECGVYYRYTIKIVEVTDHLIDSVQVVDSVITNFDKVYIKIFFRVAEQ